MVIIMMINKMQDASLPIRSFKDLEQRHCYRHQNMAGRQFLSSASYPARSSLLAKYQILVDQNLKNQQFIISALSPC
jgi:hypothetical protein